jgi:cytoskeleton protein RodZ
MTDTVATQDNAETLLPEDMPGAQLKKARERKQLSTQEVADVLNLKHSFVLMMEADQYDSLPGATFVRGYLRAYSKLVGVDPEKLLDVYNLAFKEDAKLEQRYKPIETIKPQRSFSDPLIKYTTLVVIAALIALSIIWWQSRNGSESLSLSASDTVTVETSEGETIVASMDITKPDEASVEDDSAVDDNGDVDATGDDTDHSADTATDEIADSDSTTVAGSGVDAAKPDEKVVEAPPVREEARVSPAKVETAESIDMDAINQHTFTINFDEECWVEVTDARGIKVVSNLKKPGEESLVKGLPPFKLMIGNAGGARVTYQGKNVDLKAHTNKNNIARFTLGK